MGVFDKVKFWKQSEEPVGSPPDYDLGARQFDTSNPNGTPPLDQGYGADPLAQHDPLQQAGNQFSQSGDGMFGHEPQQYPPQPFAQQYPGSTPFPGSPQQSQQPPQGYAQQAQPQFSQPYPYASVQPRDVELIIEKLDGIKSELDALHQRVRKIEQAYDTKEQQQKRYW